MLQYQVVQLKITAS